MLGKKAYDLHQVYLPLMAIRVLKLGSQVKFLTLTNAFILRDRTTNDLLDVGLIFLYFFNLIIRHVLLLEL
jgi:hypothetical protein